MREAEHTHSGTPGVEDCVLGLGLGSGFLLLSRWEGSWMGLMRGGGVAREWVGVSEWLDGVKGEM